MVFYLLFFNNLCLGQIEVVFKQLVKDTFLQNTFLQNYSTAQTPDSVCVKETLVLFVLDKNY